jgi:hypothetical protein
MNGCERNDSPGRGRGRRRSWPRWAAALAAMALMGLLATACGGGSSPASASGGGGGGGSTQLQKLVQAQLAYARCMRAHGVPDFPDPDSNGSGFDGVPAASSQMTAADHVCHHLLSAGAPHLSPAQQQHLLGQLVQYAQCMRAHGLPDFADPHPDNGGYIMGGDTDRNSPQYIAANQACRHLLPKGSLP